MDLATDTLVVSAVLGFIAPLIVAVFSRPHLSSTVKQIIALVIAVILAVIALAVTGGFTGDWYTVIVAVVGLSQAAYTLIWKLSGTAPAIEAKVNNPPKALPVAPTETK